MDAIARERGPRSARRAQGQSAAAGLRAHALRAGGRGLRNPARDDRGARGVLRLSRAPRPHRRLQRNEPAIIKRGIALTPVKFGISFTLIPTQPGRRAGACLFRRLDPSQSRRHRDGAGALHQGRAGRGGRIRRAAPLRPHHRDQHRESAERLADRRLVRHRSQRHGGEDRRGGGQAADDRLRRPAMGRRPGDRRVPRRAGLRRQRLDELRRTGQGLPPLAGAAFRTPAITRRRKSTGIAPRRKEGRSTISRMARPARRSPSTR